MPTISSVPAERLSLAERHAEALRLLRERNDQLAQLRLEVARLRAELEAVHRARGEGPA